MSTMLTIGEVPAELERIDHPLAPWQGTLLTADRQEGNSQEAAIRVRGTGFRL
jgi:hypothetical protein